MDGISPEHRQLVVGGEVHLWGELTETVSLDSTLWSRVAAAAEVIWSGTSKMPDEDTTRRLAEFREACGNRGEDGYGADGVLPQKPRWLYVLRH